MVQIVEYTVNHTRRDILGTQPVTPTVDLRRVLHTIERGFNVLNKHYDKKRKKRVSKYSLKWWLHRESNPSYRRERAVSWPLDHGALIKTGNVLLSQAASHQVSSALRSLTTVFEMGTGVTSSLLSPDFLLVKFTYHCVATRSLRYSHTLVCSVPRNSCALCYANFPSQSFIFCTLKTK